MAGVVGSRDDSHEQSATTLIVNDSQPQLNQTSVLGEKPVWDATVASGTQHTLDSVTAMVDMTMTEEHLEREAN